MIAAVKRGRCMSPPSAVKRSLQPFFSICGKGYCGARTLSGITAIRNGVSIVEEWP